MPSPKQTTSEAAVLQANAAFYLAFTRGDFPAMAELWAAQAPVACFHPGAPALIGRGAVVDGWRQIMGEGPPFEMHCERAHVQLLGDCAIVTCYECNGDNPAHLAATNVFVLENGSWRMVHHHAGPLARMAPPRSAPTPSSAAN
jgi:ketosteroid isomerase-like protein